MATNPPKMPQKTTKPPIFTTGDDLIDINALNVAYQLQPEETLKLLDGILKETESDVKSTLRSKKVKGKKRKKEREYHRQALLKELLEAMIEWGPRQAVLVLYMRWAKKAKNHFHSDSLAVLDCLLSRYPQAFPSLLDIMKGKSLYYQPCIKNRQGGEFCNTMGFTSRFINKEDGDDDDVVAAPKQKQSAAKTSKSTNEDSDSSSSEDEEQCDGDVTDGDNGSSSSEEETEGDEDHSNQQEDSTAAQIEDGLPKGTQQLLEEAKLLDLQFPDTEDHPPSPPAPAVTKNAPPKTNKKRKKWVIPKKKQRFAMSKLADNIAYFESMILKPTCSGKSGMRSSGISSQVREFTERKKSFNKNTPLGERTMHVRKFFTQNLLEFHKPESFRLRIERCITHRWLAYNLCRMLFQGRKYTDDDVFNFSIQLTQQCTYRHDLLTILAGICLKWTNTSEIDWHQPVTVEG